MNNLIMSVKKMPVTVLLAWLFLLALFTALSVIEPMVAVAVVVVVGPVVAVKRLFTYYVTGK